MEAKQPEPELSVVLPAHNEQDLIAGVLAELGQALAAAGIDYELVAVDDNSTDRTGALLEDLARSDPRLKVIHRREEPGIGRAIRAGLAAARGEAVAIVMGDGSDDPADVARCFRRLGPDCDCVFGSRFLAASRVGGYPPFKLALNRAGNALVRLLFGLHTNDTSNAFKLYRRRALAAIGPLEGEHFEITLELPLRAVACGCRYAVIPINWRGREKGVSKLRLARQVPRYLGLLFRLWLG